MYESQILQAATKYGVPVPWIQAVIETESSWVPTVHPTGDGYGLMQLLETTARGLGFTGDVSGLFDPATNIDLGTKYLRQLRNSYGDNFQRVYSAYNSGNPDLYLTSSQVAANVSRAVGFLTKWTNAAVGAVTGNPLASAIVILGAALLVSNWVQKK